jgi:uncharacterized DUF497 family protein
MVRFEWDDAKNRGNQHKHGVSFELAQLVFNDPYALTLQDRIERGEERWHAIGLVAATVVLVIAHTVRAQEAGETIRIISARKATRQERKRYEAQANR